MKYYFILAVLAALLNSCGNAIKNETTQSPIEFAEDTITYKAFPKEPEQVTVNNRIDSVQDLIGYWVGDFEPDYELLPDDYDGGETEWWNPVNKINLSIDYLVGDSVFGHSVVAGNRRTFKGILQRDSNTFRIEVSEPGDDKYDGVFKFLVGIQDTVLSGTWRSNGKVKTPFRKYSLSKMLFVYDATAEIEGIYFDWTKIKNNQKVFDGEETYLTDAFLTARPKSLKINPSVKKLSKREVENLSKGDLIILRNSIYARHGYSFKKIT